VSIDPANSSRVRPRCLDRPRNSEKEPRPTLGRGRAGQGIRSCVCPAGNRCQARRPWYGQAVKEVRATGAFGPRGDAQQRDRAARKTVERVPAAHGKEPPLAEYALEGAADRSAHPPDSIVTRSGAHCAHSIARLCSRHSIGGRYWRSQWKAIIQAKPSQSTAPTRRANRRPRIARSGSSPGSRPAVGIRSQALPAEVGFIPR
jgi:hypothetical protein